jgi:hypothetical protein
MTAGSQAQDSIQATSAQTLTAVAIQDEPRKLPKDITALVSRADRRVRFEIVKLAGASGQSLADKPLTLIDSEGTKTTLQADSTGIATLENAKPGMYAVVSGSEQGHSATAVVIRESDEVPAGDLPIAMAPTVKIPLVEVDPVSVMELASRALPAPGTASFGDIDGDFVSTGSVSNSFGYRVMLGNAGQLTGQVISLVRGGVVSADVAGTSVMIYRGNSLVGKATADAQGFFRIDGVGPGVFGLIAVGPGGYAAFGFETYSPQTIARSVASRESTLVSAAAPGDGDLLPVVLVPPALVEPMLVSLEQSYGALLGPGAGVATAGVGALAPAAMAGVGAGMGGGGSGAGGAGGSIGGLGALGLAAAAIPAAVIAAESSDDDSPGFNVSISQ